MKSRSLFNLKEHFGRLIPAEFVDRVNRFVVLARTEGEIRRAHLSDTGRLKELLTPSSPLLLAPNPRGKLDYKVVAVKKGSEWVLINTQVHSKVAQSLIEKGYLGFRPESVLREVKVGGSRIDFLIDGNFYLEVKGCNLAVNGTCLFPDAPTERGRKHLEELLELKKRGYRAGVLFLAFRDCSCFLPNFKTDPEFGRTFRRALSEGVEFFGFRLSLNLERGELLIKSPLELCESLKNFNERLAT